jgi:hypothetical protein
MTDSMFHSFRDTTFHVFRYGRSYWHAATLDRTGAILPAQDFDGAWHHAWDSEYHEGDAARGFNAEQALENIESDGYHLFKFHPRIEVVGSEPTLHGAMDAKAVKKLLKPVDRLILELKSALEHYNAEEKIPRVRAENGALLRKAEAMSHRLEEIGS